MEIAEQQASEMEIVSAAANTIQPAERRFINRRNCTGGPRGGRLFQKGKPDRNLCKYCGSNHTFCSNMCPAFGHACAKCGKLNHFEAVCRSSMPHSSNKDRQGYRGRGNYRQPSRRGYAHHAQYGRVNQVTHLPPQEDSDEHSDEYTFTVINSKGKIPTTEIRLRGTGSRLFGFIGV